MMILLLVVLLLTMAMVISFLAQLWKNKTSPQAQLKMDEIDIEDLAQRIADKIAGPKS